MPYQDLAKAIIDKIGGKENVVSVTNCITRLRFELKDFSKPKMEEVKNIDGVIGAVNQGGQFQVIIGTHVTDVIKNVRKELGINNDSQPSEAIKIEEGPKGNMVNRFFKMISSIILPIVPPLIGGGILKGIIAALVGFGILSNTDGTYQILYGAADAVLYFFPVIIGFSAAKVFNMNNYLGAVIGAALVYPNLISAETLSFLQIPVVKASYASTIFPVIAAVWFASIVSRFCEKVIPKMVQNVINPSIVIAVAVPLTYIIIGPLMNELGNGLSAAIKMIFSFSPQLAGAILGGFWQLLVVLGIHWAIIPIIINDIATNGSSMIDACVGLGHFGIAGMALGYALKNKNKKQKANGFSSFAVTLCGVTEPAIYSIGLNHIKVFACALIGSGVGGFIMAMFGGETYGFGGSGLFNGPLFIGPNGFDTNFVLWAICAGVSLTIATTLAYFISPREELVK